MKIDEEKKLGIYKVKQQGTTQCRKVYIDCNAITTNNIITSAKWKQTTKGKSLQKRSSEVQEIHKTKTNKIIKKGTLKESYNKWTQ